MNNYIEKDLKYIWHPCSQMKDYEELPLKVIQKGEGCYLYDIEGKSYLDCISSWWTNLFGHSNKRVNDALKMSFHYHQHKGNNKKIRFAAIGDAYHGETLGALSVCDLDLYNKIYKPLLLNTLRVKGPDCYRCSYGKARESCNAECFEHMERALEESHEELCGIIIEPIVQGAAGMKIYSPMYLKKLREACDRYNIHLIADEIAVGFGRTGKMFACEHAEISPDIMCLSKGISAGYMPMSVVMTSNNIYDVFYGEYKELKAFLHSHTYAGNAMACAIALENLKIFEEENVIENNKGKGELIKKLTKDLAKDHPYVGEVRSMGMITAIELIKNKETKETFPWEERVGYEIYKIALEKGLLLRPIGNVLYFLPPYVINKHDIEFMINTCFESINEYFKI
ncbi:adenosylmethionine--8-amino-7-oxononanoate transaminase [Clostridium lundense]|uniref:adenosylmethionine--8-amino-7-oxononanoate transaminase n=1 Tax=Clostridium lundense TaxID=319475 RepID=UPI000481507F|nr:adenosylmethionine--8-amino-7-oxononanoate transaminase [Clostridium lundense]